MEWLPFTKKDIFIALIIAAILAVIIYQEGMDDLKQTQEIQKLEQQLKSCEQNLNLKK